MRIRLFVITLALMANSISCDSSVRSNSELTADVPSLTVLRPIIARMSERGSVSIESTESRIVQATELSGSQFVNATKGWAFSGTSLFVTSDSAKSWKRLPLDLPENARVSSIFFNDETRGWLARNIRSVLDPYGPGNVATILVTYDGGASWIEQVTFPDRVRINRLKFYDANHGLALGSRLKDHKPPYDEIFVAKTVDGGKTWTEISHKMKAAVDNGGGFAVGQGRDAHWLSSSNILLLIAPDGRLISTSDGGESWKINARFQDERPDGTISSVTYFKLVSDPAQRIRVIAGATGDEGYWGDFVVQDDQKTWKSYELGGMPIFEAMFLSENEILACGRDFRGADGKGKMPAVGIILYSSDTGKNWIPLYRTRGGDAFIGLSKVGSNQFYAVSETGTVLRFTLSTNTAAQVRSPSYVQ
jgi:photosystem II stability/assembly factor-like uncharacterized protein